MLHAGDFRDRVEPSFADEADHSSGGGVVRPPDHRSKEVELPLLQVASANIRASEVGHEQHRLQDAGRGSDVAGVVAVQAAGLVDHRKVIVPERE